MQTNSDDIEVSYMPPEESVTPVPPPTDEEEPVETAKAVPYDDSTSIPEAIVPNQDRPVSAVPESDTVPPKVLFQPEHRRYTDIWFGVLYLMAYLAFIGCGIAIAVNAESRYYVEKDGTRRVSDHFQDDVDRCCASIQKNDGSIPTFYDLCANQRRYLAETGDSDFSGDEGIFDVFLDSPEIIIGILALTIVVGILWIVLLRFCAKPIVILTELAKIGLFVYAGIAQEYTASKIFCFVIAGGILIYAIWARKEILFAGDIISYSTVSFKENPIMFVALIALQLVFVGNAFLFVYFFSKSFDNAEVQQEVYCDGYTGVCTSSCVFGYKSYLTGATIYMSLAYLWTIFLFRQMRLSVIATIVGSWHFHPEEKAGVIVALRNTVTTSFGTLSLASLISTVAEKLNRMAQEPWYKSWLGPAFCITAPLSIFLCIFGACVSMIIKMLTKFAVILHVWTGLAFVGSAKKVFKIMKRHFKGGFVTEVTSRGVLTLGAYVFSLGIAMLTWVWVNDKYNADSLPGGREGIYAILAVLVGLFALWYPILGLYLIILADRWLRTLEYQHIWVPPLAGIFVGCLAMIFFTFIAEIFMDTIDTLFLCFAVDKDNGVSKDSELDKLVSAVPVYIGEVTKEEDPNMAVAVGTPIHSDTGVSYVDDEEAIRSEPGDKVKTTITAGPKGKKTIREVTHLDGSKTITETVETYDDEAYVMGVTDTNEEESYA